MYLDFTYFAKQDSDLLSISSLISMFGYRGGLDGEASSRNLKCMILLRTSYGYGVFLNIIFKCNLVEYTW